jgi:outer membrane protein OmpA-like peptidoglycan-associated protein
MAAADDDAWLAAGKRGATEEHWIPLSDLMTGLMMIFMLISVISLAAMEHSRNAIRQVAKEYSVSRHTMYLELQREFAPDLRRWRARIDPDLSVKFEQPDMLFATGKSALNDEFRRTLNDFFPRYIRIMGDKRFADNVAEIRIEGHTSSLWNGAANADDAYFRNMELSQSRTRSTLEYVLLLPQVNTYKTWLTKKLTANGLSSSQPVLNADGTENVESSQRVEFKVRTNAEAKMEEIVDQGMAN